MYFECDTSIGRLQYIITVGLGLLILASALNTFVNLNSSWAKGKGGNDVNTVIGSTSNVKINSGSGDDVNRLVESGKNVKINSGSEDDVNGAYNNNFITGNLKINSNGGDDSNGVTQNGGPVKINSNGGDDSSDC
jgi:hypothetical protein